MLNAGQQIGIALGQDIITEFHTMLLMVIPDPNHGQEILEIHSRKVQIIDITHSRMRSSINKVLESLVAYAAINNLDVVLNKSELQN